MEDFRPGGPWVLPRERDHSLCDLGNGLGGRTVGAKS